MDAKENFKFPFYKTAIRLGVYFIIAFICIDVLFSVFSKEGLHGYLTYFINGHWKMYIISKITGGAIYGIIMSFIMKRKAEKMKS